MCANEFLRKKAATMGPTEQLIVDREWIEWFLGEHPCECGATSQRPASPFGYSVKELAVMFDNAGSTIRGWCAKEVFGDPKTLKPTGGPWFVPPRNVTELQEKLAVGWKITGAGLKKPAETKKTERPEGTEVGRSDSTGRSKLETTKSSTPKTLGRRASKHRRHNEWRNHVPSY